MKAIDILDCEICGLPSEELRRYTMGGTAIAIMRKIGCINGHFYDEVIEFIDEPEDTEEQLLYKYLYNIAGPGHRANWES